jgi:glycosyltransferase involved in cell wall biosynthesis
VLEGSTGMTPMDRHIARIRTGVHGSPAVLWVGRLDANKDPLTVLAGFARALEEFPDATLTMVFGASALLADVTRCIENSVRLRARVRLIGELPHAELATWYSAADLFVLGSQIEAAGYALIEACACGTVPVVTDIAPFRAITGDGAIGHHWRVGDGDACSRALCAAAASAGEEDRRRVRERFASHLSWRAVGQRARAIYEAVCSSRRQPGRPTPAC